MASCVTEEEILKGKNSVSCLHKSDSSCTSCFNSSISIKTASSSYTGNSTVIGNEAYTKGKQRKFYSSLVHDSHSPIHDSNHVPVHAMHSSSYESSRPCNENSTSATTSGYYTMTSPTKYQSLKVSSLVHSVLRSDRNKHSLVYWDNINELLDQDDWIKLGKVAADMKQVADLLLTDNNCLSISKYT